MQPQDSFFRVLFRGLLLTSPALILGILLAPYISPRMAGIGVLLLTLLCLYIAGALLKSGPKETSKW